MAKRRHKKRAKRNVVGLRRKVKISAVNLDGLEEIINRNENKAGRENTVDDLKLKVQFTETTNLDTTLKNSVMYDMKFKQCKDIAVEEKRSKSKGSKPVNKQHCNNDENKDEVWIYPTKIDGETCIDIQCGANDALMYLDRLCVGSQGACIKFVDSWLTPNEFQMVSGRETAKDWKRSIRHKGRSLKLLITKGLINVQKISKQSSPKSTRATPVKPYKTEPDFKQNERNSSAKPEGVENICLSLEKSDTADTLQPKSQCHGFIKRRGRKSKTFRERRLTNRNVGKARTDEPNRTDKTFKIPDVTSGYTTKAVRAETVMDKASDSTDKSGEIAYGDNQVPTDICTDEERRLHEFVKSLRLTKNNGQTTGLSKSSTVLSNPVVSTSLVPSLKDVTNEPEFITGTAGNKNHDSSIESPDPEMPILQKEADVINDYDATALAMSVSVDVVNATVTPPPTPPCDNVVLEIMSQSIDSLKHTETFKSTLASPCKGLKLTINREKVNSLKDFRDSDTPVDTKPVLKSESLSLNQKPEAVTKALLLQDALKSARKYKEQLHQNQLKSPTKSTVFVSTATVEPTIQYTSVNTASRDQTDKRDTKRTTKGYNRNAMKAEMQRTGIPSDVTRKRCTEAMTPSVHLSSIEDIQRHSAKTFEEFMLAMRSVSGAIPMPADQRDTANPSFCELQKKYDMLKAQEPLGVASGSLKSPQTSSLLHPIITQQLLLAMAQQLQSMYNIPDTPVPVPNIVSSGLNHKQHNNRFVSRTSGGPHSKQNPFLSTVDDNRQYCTTPIDAHVAKAHHNDIGQLRNAHSMHDNHARKRKHFEVNNDGAIDLSMKKLQTSVNSHKLTCVLNNDGPLDFSLKSSHSSHSSAKSTSNFMPYSSHNICSSSTKGTTSHSPTHSNVTTHHTPVPPLSTYRNHTNLVTARSCLCTCGPGNSAITSWSVEQVCSFLLSVKGCAPYTKTFREQGISGRLLPYLTSQHLTRTLGIAPSRALSLMNAIERHLRDQKSLKCSTCRAQNAFVAMPTHL